MNEHSTNTNSNSSKGLSKEISHKNNAVSNKTTVKIIQIETKCINFYTF